MIRRLLILSARMCALSVVADRANEDGSRVRRLSRRARSQRGRARRPTVTSRCRSGSGRRARRRRRRPRRSRSRRLPTG